MSLFGITDTTRCCNCGDEFGNHDYVPESIDQYKCPHPYIETVYGFFHGGDPRDFHPDREECSPDEIENHRLACEVAEAQAEGRELPCPSGYIYDANGDWIAHVLRAPFGIGTYQYEMETFFEPVETDNEDEDESEGPF